MYNQCFSNHIRASPCIFQTAQWWTWNLDPTQILNSCNIPWTPWTLEGILCRAHLELSRSFSFWYLHTFHFCFFQEALTTADCLLGNTKAHVLLSPNRLSLIVRFLYEYLYWHNAPFLSSSCHLYMEYAPHLNFYSIWQARNQ